MLMHGDITFEETLAFRTTCALVEFSTKHFNNVPKFIDNILSGVRIIMNSEMLKKLSEKPEGSTNFQMFDPNIPNNVVDLTKRRLETLVSTSQNDNTKKMFEALLSSYLQGKLMVGWLNASKPVFRQVKK
jgi:hypothetical protein